MDWLDERIEEWKQLTNGLLSEPKLHFDVTLRSKLPTAPGLYAISLAGSTPGEFLRVGQTDGAEGLRQRVYHNHLMRSQPGNLRAQVVADRQCEDLTTAKDWIRSNLVVQVLVEDDPAIRRWAEHFTISILRPKYGE